MQPRGPSPAPASSPTPPALVSPSHPSSSSRRSCRPLLQLWLAPASLGPHISARALPCGPSSSHAWPSSHCPLDPFPGPAGLSVSPRPLLRPIRPSLPLGPRLRCRLSVSIPAGSRFHLGPCPALAVGLSPSSALHPLRPQPPWPPSPTLPPSSLPHDRPDTHYSLSSTMSLRGSAAARCPPGCPPASRRPLCPWPGPARLPGRLRRGLLRARRSRCGRRAGSCVPASPTPAPLPTPPGAPVPQRRAGAGRLCGNQSVTRSATR